MYVHKTITFKFSSFLENPFYGLNPPSSTHFNARDPCEVSNTSYGSQEFFEKPLKVTVLPVGALNRYL